MSRTSESRLKPRLKPIANPRSEFPLRNYRLDGFCAPSHTKEVADRIGLVYGRAPLKAKTELHISQINMEINRLRAVQSQYSAKILALESDARSLKARKAKADDLDRIVWRMLKGLRTKEVDRDAQEAALDAREAQLAHQAARTPPSSDSSAFDYIDQAFTILGHTFNVHDQQLQQHFLRQQQYIAAQFQAIEKDVEKRFEKLENLIIEQSLILGFKTLQQSNQTATFTACTTTSRLSLFTSRIANLTSLCGFLHPVCLKP